MRLPGFVLFAIGLVIALNSFSQFGGGVRTRDGYFLASRNKLIATCLGNLNTDENNPTALKICHCQVDLLDGRYSSKEITRYQKKYGDSGVNALIKEDTLLKKEVDACYQKQSYTSFLKVPVTAQRFKDSCKVSFKRVLEEKYDEAAVDKYCGCAVNILKDKNLTEKEFEDLFDVNSLLYNEVNYYCGTPAVSNSISKWSAANSNDIAGAAADTIRMIAMNGMQKLKIRIGSFVKVAMLDCGATDLLVPGTLMKQLLADSAISEDIKFIDIGKYELANGSLIECKRYQINKLYIGKFQLNNIILASTEKNITILVGRTVLNKFRKWNIDNERNLLILEK